MRRAIVALVVLVLAGVGAVAWWQSRAQTGWSCYVVTWPDRTTSEVCQREVECQLERDKTVLRATGASVSDCEPAKELWCVELENLGRYLCTSTQARCEVALADAEHACTSQTAYAEAGHL